MSAPRVVVVGSGGREHALARRLAADPDRADVVVVPGNDGIAAEFGCRTGDLRDVEALAAACAAETPELVIVGPEGPLAAGLVDRLVARGITAFGPSAEAARLESSKAFAKQLLAEAGVPTAESETFEALEPLQDALGRFGPPWVVKADGLAAGKGVRVTSRREEALGFARDCLAGDAFGEAGRRVLLERFLAGSELSVMAVCDGERATLLPAARDYKRARDGDVGDNTGGMGGYAPVSGVGADAARVRERVVEPVLGALARHGVRFRGTLYCGLMVTRAGLRVLEFNVRFGDPEAQVVLPLVGGSLRELLSHAARARLAPAELEPVAGAVVAVAIVDARYPEPPSGQARLEGVERLTELEGVDVLFAGVARDGSGWRLTGGRGAYVRATGGTLAEARARAYAAIDRLGGRGWRCRRDVAAAECGVTRTARVEA